MQAHLERNAIAYLALFVALGGTGYAAVQPPRNSVGKAQIRKGAVDSRAVRNGSLRVVDLHRSARGAGPRGATGPAGPQGRPAPPARRVRPFRQARMAPRARPAGPARPRA